MSIARGFSPLDIMTLGDFRGANEAGDGLVVFAETLDTVLWANHAGRALLGLDPDQRSLAPMSGLSRQIRATARLIATRGEARLLLRPATGLAAQPVVADLRHVETCEGMPVVVLAASAPQPAAASLTSLADRLLSESGLDDAAIYAEDGAQVSSATAPAFDATRLPAEIAALIGSDEPQRFVADAGLTLARVARGLVLVRCDRPALSAAPSDPIDLLDEGTTAAMPGDPEGVIGADQLNADTQSEEHDAHTENLVATSMSAIVRRWHSRGTPSGLAPAWRPADASAPSDASEGGDAPGPTVEPDKEQARDAASADNAAQARGIDPVNESAGDADASGATRPVPADAIAPVTPHVPERRRSVWAMPAPSASDPQPDRVSSADAARQTPWSADNDAADDGTGSGSDAEMVSLPTDAGGDPEERPTAARTPQRSVWGPPVTLTGAPQTMPGNHSAIDDPAPSATDPLGSGETATPNDGPASDEGEAGQPIDKPTPNLVPDFAPDEQADLDNSIIENEERPAKEDLYPGADERQTPEGFAATDATDQGPPGANATSALSADTVAAEPVPVAEGVAPDLSDTPAIDTDIPSADNDELAGISDAALPVDTVEPAEGDDTAAGADAPFMPRFSGAPVRFVWQIDRDGKFRSLTPEFSAAVGPKAADVAGRSFREVADVFGFDTSGEISRLLERRDTWSGRSILWPVEASDRKVPVDLAALPVYARDRSFDGFRGFGIVRLNESVPDPEAVGMILADVGALASPSADREPESTAEETATDLHRPAIKTFEAAPPPPAFGRRPEPPVSATSASAETTERPEPAESVGEPKIIRLEERRRPRDGTLSMAEEAAFRAIGMTLGQERPETRKTEVTDAIRSAGASEAELAGENPRSQEASSAASAPRQGEASVDGEESLAAPRLDTDGPVTLPPLAQQDDVLPETASDMTSVDGDANTADFDGRDLRAISVGVAERQTNASEPIDDPSEPAVPFLPEVMAAELEAIFASLPLPVLIQMHETLIYANREFEDLSGYQDLADLEAAGGLDVLFAESTDDLRQGELAIRRSNGQIMDVRVHMQRATFAGRSCLMMSFSPSPRESAAVAAAPAEPSEHAIAEVSLARTPSRTSSRILNRILAEETVTTVDRFATPSLGTSMDRPSTTRNMSTSDLLSVTLKILVIDL